MEPVDIGVQTTPTPEVSAIFIMLVLIISQMLYVEFDYSDIVSSICKIIMLHIESV